ncbi:hypothetical protein SB781_03400 [Paraburkholderia sp. SIMBA_061]
MNAIGWLTAAIFFFALIGIAAAVIHSLIWPVDTARPDFHRPLEQRTNRDAPERR